MKEFEHSLALLIDSLGANPIIGTSISLITASFGMMLSGGDFLHDGIPTLIKDVFQMLAWVCTIAVSVLTILGWIKKNINFKKKKK